MGGVDWPPWAVAHSVSPDAGQWHGQRQTTVLRRLIGPPLSTWLSNSQRFLSPTNKPVSFPHRTSTQQLLQHKVVNMDWYFALF